MKLNIVTIVTLSQTDALRCKSYIYVIALDLRGYAHQQDNDQAHNPNLTPCLTVPLNKESSRGEIYI